MATIKVRKKGKPGVSPSRSQATRQQTTGFGYIIIPEGVDRDQFVETCYRKCRVTIVDDGTGNVINDCYITNEAIQNVKFPRLVGEKGVPVVWVSQPYQTEPMVIGTFLPQEKINVRDDEEFNIRREWDKGLLVIEGSAKDGSLFINVRGEEFGYIKITADGNEQSVLDLTSAGKVKVTANEDVDVTAFKNLLAKVIDPETRNESGISVNKDELTLSSTYGEEDEKNTFKTTVTMEGVVSDIVFNSGEEFHEEITVEGVKSSQTFDGTTISGEVTKDGIKTVAEIDGSSYESTVDSEKALIQFMDSFIKLEDKKATFQQGDAYLVIENGKLAMINGGTGLNELLTKVVDAIATLTVSTGVGPSGTPLPPTIQKTEELTQLLSQFFNK